VNQEDIDRMVRRDVKVFFVNFFDALRDGLARRDQHRAEHALLRFYTMRRGTVNILRRTCWRIRKNSSAISNRRTSASAITRCFTRFPRLRALRTRHLFGFFSLREKPTMFFLRLLGRSTHCLGLWFFCGFHLKNKLCCYIVMQLERPLVLPGIFDRTLKANFVPIDFCAELVLEPVYDVLGGNGAKRFASFARFQ